VGQLQLKRVAVRDLQRPRPVNLPAEIVCTSPEAVVDDPAVDIVVEVMGGLEPARSLILRAIAAGRFTGRGRCRSRTATRLSCSWPTRGWRPSGLSRISATPAPTVPSPSKPMPMVMPP
jgi:hypothetical protein